MRHEEQVLSAAEALGIPVARSAADLADLDDAQRRDPPGPLVVGRRGRSTCAVFASPPSRREVDALSDAFGPDVEIVLASGRAAAELALRVGAPTLRPSDGWASILDEAIRLGATDVHLGPGAPPAARIATVLSPMTGFDPLSEDDVAAFADRIAADRDGDVDLGITYRDRRLRVNVYRQRGQPAIACRLLPITVPDLDALGLPRVVQDLASAPDGLVLVCGPTGSGKSTSLAALVERINRTRAAHITTIEDPIEYLHADVRSVIHQREVGRDTDGFAAAVRSALRQDPDVMLIGEMRDAQTIDAALTAAETGHLVLSTLHTGDVASSVHRVISAFPREQQTSAQARLANAVRAVVCQKLLPRRDSSSRVGVVAEILVADVATSAVIRDGGTHRLPSLVATGATKGMQTFDQALARAVRDGWLDPVMARSHCRDERAYTSYLARCTTPAG